MAGVLRRRLGHTQRGHREKMDIYKPGRGDSEETNSDDTSISDF